MPIERLKRSERDKKHITHFLLGKLIIIWTIVYVPETLLQFVHVQISGWVHSIAA